MRLGETTTLDSLIATGCLERQSCRLRMDTTTLAGKLETNSKSKKKQKQPPAVDDYTRIGLFESTAVSPSGTVNFTAFVGGLPWAMCWCPTETRPHHSPTQYLAIAAIPSDRGHTVFPDTTYRERVVLQLWDCGKLPKSPGGYHGALGGLENVSTPFVALGLVLNDSGPIWSMDWRRDFRNGGTTDHLGEIAIASGAGEVHIFTVPVPDSALGTCRFVEALPSLRLLPDHRSGMSHGQCMSVGWSVYHGSPVVAAGFASGAVFVWDVDATSALLDAGVDADGTRRLFPIMHAVNAHRKAVRTLSFCPYDPAVFATGGFDRHIRLWNLNDLSRPVHANNREKGRTSFINEICWSNQYNGLFIATGSEFSSVGYSGAMFFDLTKATMDSMCLVPYQTGSWTIDTNNWMNVTASGCDGGSMVLAVHQYPINMAKRNKAKYQKRLMIMQMTAVESAPEVSSTRSFLYM